MMAISLQKKLTKVEKTTKYYPKVSGIFLKIVGALIEKCRKKERNLYD